MKDQLTTIKYGHSLSAKYQSFLFAAMQNPCYETYLRLAKAFHSIGYLAEAETSYSKALSYQPSSAEAQFWLAILIKEGGDYQRADQVLEQVIQLKSQAFPAQVVYSEQIYLHHYNPSFDQQRQMEILQSYRQLFEKSKSTRPLIAQDQPRPLRVGFVSADFRNHPVSFFLDYTLKHIQQDSGFSCRVTLIAYSNFDQEDEYTQRLRQYFLQWRRVDQLSDADLIAQIQMDHIDVLIDLAGHTQPNRLPVFAQQAAPLQISWLGYFRSTGLTSIDYVLADPICAPKEEEQWFVEKIWRLPHLRYCLSIPEYAPEVSQPPCCQRQEFIFGCYQILPKINERVLRCWAQILASSPHARLRLQSKPLNNEAQKNLFISRLVKAGISLQQVELLSEVPREQYLASYAQVDILLDTFPFPGGTTTAEALWMGVPTLTLETPSMLGRQGKALMVSAGLADWVVNSERDYVQQAITWANSDQHKRQTLANLRAGLRERVRHTPIFQAEQFAHHFVDAIEAMWKDKFQSLNQENRKLSDNE